MQTRAAPDSVEATPQMKMASEIIDRHRYLNMAHKKSAKSNISASAVYTDCIRDTKTKFLLERLEHPKGGGRKLEGHERLCKSFDF